MIEQLPLPLWHQPLPGLDWQEQYPWCAEHGKTCPALIQDKQGRIYRNVPGSMLAGQARYEVWEPIQKGMTCVMRK